MSFSGKVKEELLEHYARARHCDIAELSAIVQMCGAFGSGYKGVSAEMQGKIITVITFMQKVKN